MINKTKIFFSQTKIIFPLFVFLFNIFLFDYKSLAEKPRIVLSMQVSNTKVPLNRNLELTIVLKWSNDINRYEIIKIEEPVLTNFKIIGSAVSSRSEAGKGKTNFIKEYIYTLKPQSLGMGYIDSVLVRVRDNVDGITENLETQRISVEIIDPIPEGTKVTRRQVYVVLGILVALSIIGISFLLYRSKKYKDKQEIIAKPVPIEKTFLDNMKNMFNLRSPDLREDFFNLSKLIRSYLKDKFSIPALELTTEEVISALEKASLEENQINNLKKILIRTDEIKFSGKEGTIEEITQFYTLFESLLEKYYYEAEQMYKQEDKA